MFDVVDCPKELEVNEVVDDAESASSLLDENKFCVVPDKYCISASPLGSSSQYAFPSSYKGSINPSSLPTRASPELFSPLRMSGSPSTNVCLRRIHILLLLGAAVAFLAEILPQRH